MSGLAVGITAAAAATTAAVGVGSATASFIQMGKQRRAREKAEKAAAKAAAEAKSALAVAPFEALGLSIDPTQRAMDVATSIGMAGVNVGRESQRGAAAAAGRAQAIGAQQGMAARDQFTKELEQRERLIAQDAARRQTALANVALQEATGAQIAAGEAEASRRASLESGLKGLEQAAKGIAQGIDLYAGDRPTGEGDETIDLTTQTEQRKAGGETEGSPRVDASEQQLEFMAQLLANDKYNYLFDFDRLTDPMIGPTERFTGTRTNFDQ